VENVYIFLQQLYSGNGVPYFVIIPEFYRRYYKNILVTFSVHRVFLNIEILFFTVADWVSSSLHWREAVELCRSSYLHLSPVLMGVARVFRGWMCGGRPRYRRTDQKRPGLYRIGVL